MKGRIFFPGNPWPEGHAIESLVWSGRLDPDEGLFLNLDLRSADYYAERDIEDDEDAEGVGSWQAPIVWGNYHACSLSSTKWHGRDNGFLVSLDEPFSFVNIGDHILVVDDLEDEDVDEIDLDDRRFHIYLLGHDDVASHEIHFLPSSDDTCELVWTGKVALAYGGDYDFDYEFRVQASQLRFDGIVVPEGLSKSEAEAALAEHCVEASRFVLRETKQGRRFVLRKGETLFG